MASYAEVVKKDMENLEANIVVKENKPVRSRQGQTNEEDDNYSENRDANIFRSHDKDFNENAQKVKEIKDLLVNEVKDETQKPRKRSTRDVCKLSKPTMFLVVAVDIALAGLLVGSVYKKPTINRMKLGFSTVGLSLFYGLQWYVN